MDTTRTLGTVGERARISKKAPDLSEHKVDLMPRTPEAREAVPTPAIQPQSRSKLPRGWWARHVADLDAYIGGKASAESVLDLARAETGFRPSLAALATAVTNRKKTLGVRSVVAGVTVTVEQIRRARDAVTKIANDVFDFEQETIRALNELGEYIAKMHSPGGAR